MPVTRIPDEVDAFLRRPSPAVIGTLRDDGSPHTVATWYDWDGERILLSMSETRARLRFLRRDPRCALTVFDPERWSRHISLRGHVDSIEADVELRDIDRLARRYTGKPFRSRDERRVSAWVEVDSWDGWDGRGRWRPN